MRFEHSQDVSPITERLSYVKDTIDITAIEGGKPSKGQ